MIFVIKDEHNPDLRPNINITALKILATKILLVGLVMLYSFGLMAQQDPMYTQYMEKIISINPAYAGSKDLHMMVLSRDQWVSIPNAPVTRSISIDSPISGTNMGLGLSFSSDVVFPIKQTSLFADYSYKLFFSANRTLSLGIKGGVSFYEAGLSGLSIIDPNDPVFAQDINRNFLPNVGVGAFYMTDKYYVGLSVPKLIQNTIKNSGVSIQNISREKLHFFFMAGYVFDVNQIVKFKPSILTKYVNNAPVSIDLNSTFLFFDTFWLGAMYRIGDSFGGFFQLQVTSQLKIGYAYDLPIMQLGAYSSGTHEVMISYDFRGVPGKMKSPRYL